MRGYEAYGNRRHRESKKIVRRPRHSVPCSLGAPRGGSNQGISVGYADEYHYSLDGQWIDITGLPAGQYILENEVNSEWPYEESSYDNNRAYWPVNI